MEIKSIVENEFIEISPNTKIKDVERKIFINSFIIVKDEHKFYGIITSTDILKSPRLLAIDCINPKPAIDINYDLDNILDIINKTSDFVLPVFDKENFIGVITVVKIIDYLLKHRKKINRELNINTGNFKKINSHLGFEIRNKMRKKLRNRIDQIELLNKIIILCNEEYELSNFLKNTLDSILNYLKFDTGGIFLFNEKKEKIELGAFRNLDENIINEIKSDKKSKEYYNIVLKKNTPVYLSNYYESSSVLNRNNWKFYSLVYMPIHSHEKLMGFLLITSNRSYNFTHDKENLLNIIAGQIGTRIVKNKVESQMDNYIIRLHKSYRKLKKNHEQLIQSSKLAILGEITSGLAHEITQPLMGISMGIEEILFREINNNLDSSYLKGKCNDLINYIYRIRKTIDHIRVYSRKQNDEERHKCNINESIENALGLLKARISEKRIKIIKSLNNEIYLLCGNFYKLEQIIINLLSNAIDALLEKEALINKNKIMYKGKYNKVIIIKTFNKDDYVNLIIYDNGIGIKKENIKNVFESFFTTKFETKGTGMGLYIVRSLIKEINGTISVKSQYEKYTSFRIKIPRIYEGNLSEKKSIKYSYS